MDAKQLHAKTQELKEELAMAMAYGGTDAGQLAVEEAKRFLCDNYTQILDIVDDALYAYLHNNGKLP